MRLELARGSRVDVDVVEFSLDSAMVTTVDQGPAHGLHDAPFREIEAGGKSLGGHLSGLAVGLVEDCLAASAETGSLSVLEELRESRFRVGIVVIDGERNLAGVIDLGDGVVSDGDWGVFVKMDRATDCKCCVARLDNECVSNRLEASVENRLGDGL